MPPADGTSRRAGKRLRVRCETCGVVLATRHAWDKVTCDCGVLTLSGRRKVFWLGRPGGGWSEVKDEKPDAGAAAVAAADEIDTSASGRRIGF